MIVSKNIMVDVTMKIINSPATLVLDVKYGYQEHPGVIQPS